MSRISKKEIGRCFKLILKALETSVDLITTGDFMSRFCSNLGLPKQVQMAATHIARKAVELDLVPGRSPISVAAAAIYMASQASAEKRTQKGKTFFLTFFVFLLPHVLLVERIQCCCKTCMRSVQVMISCCSNCTQQGLNQDLPLPKMKIE